MRLDLKLQRASMADLRYLISFLKKVDADLESTQKVCFSNSRPEITTLGGPFEALSQSKRFLARMNYGQVVDRSARLTTSGERGQIAITAKPIHA